jgi:hypothetical protein
VTNENDSKAMGGMLPSQNYFKTTILPPFMTKAITLGANLIALIVLN